jgi:hypothetical protein
MSRTDWTYLIIILIWTRQFLMSMVSNVV